MEDGGADRRIHWGRLAAEGAAIVFSVLVALAVDEWRESRAHAALAARARAEIVAEAAINRTELTRAIAWHDSLARIYTPNMDVALHTPFIRGVAWETAQATQAVLYMDYGFVSRASEIYQLQREFATTRQETVALIYGGHFPLGALQDLLFYERELVRRYDALEAGTDRPGGTT